VFENQTMNVLLLHNDLYLSVGGGQTIYRRLIETNPDITFYYVGVKESPAAPRPANARIVPFKEHYAVAPLATDFADLDMPQWAYDDFLEASNIAASVSGVQIDVVDVPDYTYFAYLIGPALRHHGQKSCKLILALHGNMSDSQRANWTNRSGVAVSMDQREQWQYRVADVRYGISRDYLDYWAALTGLEGHYLSPLRFLNPAAPSLATSVPGGGGVSLQFVGRKEALKGPDLFIELLAWLPIGSYQFAHIIGPKVVDAGGQPSEVYLQGLAERRSVQVQYHDCMSQAELARIYSSRSITVLPSRKDTFNLAAIESLFAGCPVAVSGKAGVCRFLRETFPHVPFVVLDMDRLYSAAPALLDLIERYDVHRHRLVDAIQNAKPTTAGLSLTEIYEHSSASDPLLCERAASLYQRVLAFYRKQRAPSYQRLSRIGVRVCEALQGQAETAKLSTGEHDHLWWLYRKIFYVPEAFAADIDRKVGFCGEVLNVTRVDRARIWGELARLERVRGNDFVASTYELRMMRATGEDRRGLLPLVLANLREGGFTKEAEAAMALYGSRDQRLERGCALLKAAFDDCRLLPERPYEFVEDTRPSQPPKVSIIVSLYKAANKLETFLRMLWQLPWVASGQAEVVFVDSHSPTDEHAVYKRLSPEMGLRAVYARTHERETIQKAWNRGILLARGAYLSFLGVDEMVRPDCFSILAAELDRDPSLDWVQGNALMTEVDMKGNLDRDVMIFQRTPYNQDLVYFETSYLSWVGGMYRRSIHERFGYYDETFGAAGDTEFKNRILPFIKSKTLPLTLGVFLNYPEERTTQSPRAEVEDLRAWYLHRSEAGVDYALATRDPGDALSLLDKAIGYRKSYFPHLSTDFDYASATMAFVSKRLPGAAVQRCAPAINGALEAYRRLDWLPRLSPRAPVIEHNRAQQAIASAASQVQEALGRKEPPTWTLFKDNRYEQHYGLWEGKPLTGRLAPGERLPWCRYTPDLGGQRPELAAGATSSVQEASTGRELEGLVAAIRQQVPLLKATDSDLSSDLEVVAQNLDDVGKDRKPSVTLDAARPSAVIARILTENQPAPLLSNAGLLSARVATLCSHLAEIAGPFCEEISDAFAGIVAQAGQLRVMEVAARLLTYKTPQEAVKRHAAELSNRVVETLQRAADAARANGNQAYFDRLTAFAVVAKQELSCVSAAKGSRESSSRGGQGSHQAN
jgi:glycosyltransferase involved in cell wall biosynthesis